MKVEIVIVTVHQASGRAIVTGPAGGIWERLAMEANPTASWNKEWHGWTLDNLNQVADLCCLASIRGAVYKERPWTPDLLGKVQARARAKSNRLRKIPTGGAA